MNSVLKSARRFRRNFAKIEKMPGVKKAVPIGDDGVAVIEAPYVKDLIEHGEFDTIYHEHLCYFSVTALDRLLTPEGELLVWLSIGGPIAGQEHMQHIHLPEGEGAGSCPTRDLDKDGDGIVSLEEGAAHPYTILVSGPAGGVSRSLRRPSPDLLPPQRFEL
jgi:hypothetical protein